MNNSLVRHALSRCNLISQVFKSQTRQFSKVGSIYFNIYKEGDKKPEQQTGPQKDPLSHEDYFNVKKLVNLKELFDARIHLGHHEGTWDPRTKPYIYGQRATQLIIDLDKTVECLKCALNVLSHIVYRNGIVAFMSTNPRNDYLIQKAARNTGEYFMTTGWKKGLFTNSQKLIGTTRLPDLIIAFNISRFERIREVIIEAAMCNIPVIGIVDTDCDPSLITYPIPANDDTYDSVTTLLRIFETAILNAKSQRNADHKSQHDSENESLSLEHENELQSPEQEICT